MENKDVFVKTFPLVWIYTIVVGLIVFFTAGKVWSLSFVLGSVTSLMMMSMLYKSSKRVMQSEKDVAQTSTITEDSGVGGGLGTKIVKGVDYETYDIVDIIMPFEELVVNMLNDGDLKTNTNIYNAPLRNVEIEISLMGISGIKTFEFFRVTNLPPPFNDDVVVFQVTNVTHVINENTWETRLKAQLRPAYNLMGK